MLPGPWVPDVLRSLWSLRGHEREADIIDCPSDKHIVVYPQNSPRDQRDSAGISRFSHSLLSTGKTG